MQSTFAMGRAAKTSVRDQMEQNESNFSRHPIRNTFPLKLATSNFKYLLIQNFVNASYFKLVYVENFISIPSSNCLPELLNRLK